MIKQVHSITILVQDLASAAAYYQNVIGLEIVKDAETQYPALAPLTGQDTIKAKSVWLDAKTTLLELMTIDAPVPAHEMAVYGSGITHVCFQSPADDPAYPRIKAGNTDMMTRGDAPVDLAGAGITYAYARDPQRNIFEMEQLNTPPREGHLWLGHVAWVTHDIARLSTFYNTLLSNDGTPPSMHFRENSRLDAVADIDNLDLHGAWIRDLDVHLEFWQYENPPTPQVTTRKPLRSGYLSVNFEVDDCRATYERLKAKQVDFLTEPLQHQDTLIVYGFDLDGNLFQLRQSISEASNE